MKIFKIDNPVECTIHKRLNRFVVEIEVDSRIARAHITNSGRLLEFMVPGRRAYAVKRKNPGKTDYRLFAVEDGDFAALIDTGYQMKAFEKLAEMDVIPWLKGYSYIQRNAPLGDSLIDYLFMKGERDVYLEVKSAAEREGIYAMYPDCPSTRGQKHIRELTDYARKGGEAFIVFMAALPGVEKFKPSRKGDPHLCDLLKKAQKNKVALKAINIYYNPANHYIENTNDIMDIELV